MAVKFDKESNSYTVWFSIIMVIVVGTLLASSSSILGPLEKKNREIEKMQSILFAMNVSNSIDSTLIVSKDSVHNLFKKHIDDRQFIIVNGEINKTKIAFETNLLREIQKEKANPDYVKKLPFFIGMKDDEKYYIIPLQGNGLWGKLWGYVSLNNKLEKIGATIFDHEKETAGLGAKITESYFRDDFKNEKIIDQDGNYVGIAVTKGNGDPLNLDKTDNEVDAIAGATITSNGISEMITKGIKLYLPHLKSID